MRKCSDNIHNNGCLGFCSRQLTLQITTFRHLVSPTGKSWALGRPRLPGSCPALLHVKQLRPVEDSAGLHTTQPAHLSRHLSLLASWVGSKPLVGLTGLLLGPFSLRLSVTKNLHSAATRDTPLQLTPCGLVLHTFQPAAREGHPFTAAGISYGFVLCTQAPTSNTS